MHEIQFIPAHWLEQSAWTARCGECLIVYSRTLTIKRRLHPLQPQHFESLEV